jgi:hypothetical protein
MRVLGYTWAGVRTSDLNSAAQFFAETLGLPQSYQGRGIVQFELLSRQLLEILGADSGNYPLPDCPMLWIPGRRLKQRERNFSRAASRLLPMSAAISRKLGYFRGPDSYLYEHWETDRGMRSVAREASRTRRWSFSTRSDRVSYLRALLC